MDITINMEPITLVYIITACIVVYAINRLTRPTATAKPKSVTKSETKK